MALAPIKRVILAAMLLNLASGRIVTTVITPSQITVTGGQGVALGALAADRPPTVMATGVAVNQSTFSIGQTMTGMVGLTNPGLTGEADIYVGTLRPDGTIEFITSAGVVLGSITNLASFQPVVASVPLATPFAVTVPDVISHQRTGSDLHGAYVFFLLVTRAGALADGMVTGDEFLGLAAAPFSFP